MTTVPFEKGVRPLFSENDRIIITNILYIDTLWRRLTPLRMILSYGYLPCFTMLQSHA